MPEGEGGRTEFEKGTRVSKRGGTDHLNSIMHGAWQWRNSISDTVEKHEIKRGDETDELLNELLRRKAPLRLPNGIHTIATKGVGDRGSWQKTVLDAAGRAERSVGSRHGFQLLAVCRADGGDTSRFRALRPAARAAHPSIDISTSALTNHHGSKSLCLQLLLHTSQSSF
jgi:hypothetical protein